MRGDMLLSGETYVMGKVLEMLTVNLAVNDLDQAVERYSKLGLTKYPPVHVPEPPTQLTDVSMPTGDSGWLSLIAPTEPDSPVGRYLDKRGQGIYSVVLRVDNLREIMEEWRQAGAEWLLEEPYEFPPGTPCTNLLPDKLIGNWLRPSSMHGVLLETLELQGEIRTLKPE
jgi:methylmalonyl-CoA/ethylmalonyl-CoA epimerase